PYNGRNISCNGEDDGSATATPAGGTGAYHYEWYSDAALTLSISQTTATAIDLTAGTYWVKVTDDNNCWISASVTLTEPVTVTATAAVTSNYHGRNISCNGAADGEVTATPAGGTAPYTYEWFTDAAMSSSTGKTTQVADGLGAGSYWVKVKDANLCETYATVTIIEPDVVTVTATVTSSYNGRDISCAGSSNGQATASPSGGTAPYTYEWFTDALMTVSTGKTTQIATGLSATTYWVKVTDANGCEGSASVTLTAPPSLSIGVAVSSDYNGAQISCSGGSDGKIMATPGGGTGSFSYTWYSNASMTIPIGQTTQEATGLGAGTYYVKVGDANGCIISGNATLVNPTALSVTATAATPYHGRNISCYGESDGSATATAAGGTGAYDYEWYSDAGLTVSIGQTTSTAINLSAGTYWVKVTDDNNCWKSASVTLTEPDVVTTTASVTSSYHGRNISCNGAADGEATAAPVGGTAPYTYEWFTDAAMTASTGITDQTATGLDATTYWVKVTDDNGCYASASVTLTQPAPLTATTAVTSNYHGRNISCNGAADGKARVTPAGGTGFYTYEWFSDAAMLTPIGQTSAEATGLTAGTYWVRIIDANTCEAVASITLDEPALLATTAAATSNFNGMNISCFGASNGTALASPTGGTAPFSYEWYSDAGLTTPIGQSTQSAIALSANTYWVNVTDANGCEASASAVITGPFELTISAPVITDADCYGQASGAINITTTGGVMPVGGYYFTWTGVDYSGAPFSGSTEDIINIKAGTYNLTVKDANNCTATLTGVSVGQPSAVAITKISQVDVGCYGSSTGEINISTSGGTGAYSYSWTGTDYTGAIFSSIDDNLTGLKAGTYNLTVTDANSCTGTLSTVTITQPAQLTASVASKTNVVCYGNSTGSIFVNVAGGTPGYTYSWTGTDYLGAAYSSSARDIFTLKAGTYTLTVTDLNTCTAIIAGVVITQSDELTPGSITGDDVLCFGEDPLQISEATAATGGPSTPEYQWQSSVTSGGPWSNIPGAQVKDYTPTASPAMTMYYRRAATSGTCLPVYSNVIEIRVNPLPAARITGGTTICAGDPAIINVEMTSGTGPFDLTLNGIPEILGYVSNSDITVSPATTTTYKIIKVVDANGCQVVDPHVNLTGTAVINVRALPVITDDPDDKTICEYGATSFTAVASGDVISWQWQVDKGTGFEDLPEGGMHYGTATPTLQIFGGTIALNGYRYRAVATGCGVVVNSGEAELTVNTSPVIETQPVSTTVCFGNNTSFSVTASGTGPGYQWQVNTGSGFGNITDGGVYSGATTATLNLTAVPVTYNNYIYRVIVSGACPSPVSSNFVTLRVTGSPTVTLNPVPKAICAEAGMVYFTANGSGSVDEMRWQVNNAGTWTDIADDAVYSGTNTPQLTFINPPASLNGREYRLMLRAACNEVPTNAATLTVYTNPVVSFATDPLTNCGGAALTMAPVITGGSGTWATHTWTGDVGPLNRYDVQGPVFKTLITGAYSLNYKVKDSHGCIGIAPVTVNVDSPDATFTQDTPSGCTPLSVQFNKDMTGVASWSWDFGDGTPANTTSANPSHEFVNTDPSVIQYRTVKLTVRSAGGCEVSKTSTVTVYPKIDATVTVNTDTICSGESVTITALAGAAGYSWVYGDGMISTGSNATTHTYLNTTGDPVERTISVTTSSFYSCTATSETKIVVMPKPLAAFSAAPVQQIYNAAGNTVVFTNETNAGAFSWSWKFGDNSTSDTKSPSHVYTAMGEFEVTLEATNGICSDKASHKVRVNPLAPVAMFDSIPSGCEPLEIAIRNTSQNTDLPGTTYEWNFGDGGTSVAKNPTYTYYDPGVYRIELTISGPGGTSYKSRVVKVYATPVASFEVTPDHVFVNDEKVRGINESVGADYFIWEWGDGDTSKIRDPFHKYMKSGTYDVSLSAFKDNGDGNICYNRFVLSPGVVVEPAGEIRFASVFKPNLTGELNPSSDNIPASQMDQFFYPPVQEKVLEYKLQIFNRQGVLIFESHDVNTPWNGYYKGKLCPQGVYVWYVEGKYANNQVYKKVGDITLLH
ncbi:MAG TPA: PKD domain-containing protein, partial [Bacteroidales bacterium]|nr:PKD domain-containing protein [Bacteroidales bacterium]